MFVDPDGKEILQSLNLTYPNPNDKKYAANGGIYNLRKDQNHIRENIELYQAECPDYSNILSFVAHGVVNDKGESANKIVLAISGNEEQSDARHVVNYLNSESQIVKTAHDNQKFSVVFLLSCATAQGCDSIAGQMSELMNSLIIAPTDITDKKGNVRNDGEWVVFHKGYILDKIPGNAEAIHEYLTKLNNRLEENK